MLTRTVNRPYENPDATAEILLTVIFGTLRPELLADAERPFRHANRADRAPLGAANRLRESPSGSSDAPSGVTAAALRAKQASQGVREGVDRGVQLGLGHDERR